MRTQSFFQRVGSAAVQDKAVQIHYSSAGAQCSAVQAQCSAVQASPPSAVQCRAVGALATCKQPPTIIMVLLHQPVCHIHFLYSLCIM
jgi:hypothetical protein